MRLDKNFHGDIPPLRREGPDLNSFEIFSFFTLGRTTDLPRRHRGRFLPPRRKSPWYRPKGAHRKSWPVESAPAAPFTISMRVGFPLPLRQQGSQASEENVELPSRPARDDVSPPSPRAKRGSHLRRVPSDDAFPSPFLFPCREGVSKRLLGLVPVTLAPPPSFPRRSRAFLKDGK